MFKEITFEVFRYEQGKFYEPYYQKHSFSFQELMDMDSDTLIKRIKEGEKLPFEASNVYRINNYLVLKNTKLKELKYMFLNNDVIYLSPASKLYCIKDFKIDMSYDYAKVEYIKENIGLDDEDIQKYKDLAIYNFSNKKHDARYHEGIGMYLFVDYLINKYPNKKHNIISLAKEHMNQNSETSYKNIIPVDKELKFIIENVEDMVFGKEYTGKNYKSELIKKYIKTK